MIKKTEYQENSYRQNCPFNGVIGIHLFMINKINTKNILIAKIVLLWWCDCGWYFGFFNHKQRNTNNTSNKFYSSCWFMVNYGVNAL